MRPPKTGMTTKTSKQYELFINNDIKRKPINGTSTFANNMKLPIHRWFRFSAGFSAEWVTHVVQEKVNDMGSSIALLDPFVGSGTSLLCADMCGIRSYGIES